jgi:glycosyl transferase family 25
MDCYVINLDRHPERWDRMVAELAKHGLLPHRLRAFDGMRLRPDTRRLAPDGGYAMSRFEIACVLSHRRAWRALVRSGAPAAMVFEDDIHVGQGIAALVTDPALLELGFDLLHLETFWGQVLVDRRQGGVVQGRRIDRLLTTHWGAAGYILTRSAAERLLRETRGAPLPADWLLFDEICFTEMGFRVGQVLPAIVVQEQLRLGPARDRGALPSAIAEDRGRPLGRKIKRRGVRRILREVTRPIGQFGDLLSLAVLRMIDPAGRRPRRNPTHPSPTLLEALRLRLKYAGIRRVLVTFE